MSKSWRGEERERRKGGARERRRNREIDYTRTSEQPDVITPEWALKRMEAHINFALERLIGQGEIGVDEKRDYAAMMRRDVVAAARNYEGGFVGPNGKPASAAHYLTVVVDNAAHRIVSYNERMRTNPRTLSLDAICTSDGEPTESRYADLISDRCKSVRDVDLRLDVERLLLDLDPVSRKVLVLRLKGYSNTEIGDVLGCCRQNVELTHLPKIRKIARICGFIPPSEARREKIRK